MKAPKLLIIKAVLKTFDRKEIPDWLEKKHKRMGLSNDIGNEGFLITVVDSAKQEGEQRRVLFRNDPITSAKFNIVYEAVQELLTSNNSDEIKKAKAQGDDEKIAQLITPEYNREYNLRSFEIKTYGYIKDVDLEATTGSIWFDNTDRKISTVSLVIFGIPEGCDVSAKGETPETVAQTFTKYKERKSGWHKGGTESL
jgi:hypothetical protein